MSTSRTTDDELKESEETSNVSESEKEKEKKKKTQVKDLSDIPNLQNRREKIVNGNIKISRGDKEGRDGGKRRQRKNSTAPNMTKGEEMRKDGDSGMGRSSAEENVTRYNSVNGTQTENEGTADPLRRTGWDSRGTDGSKGTGGSNKGRVIPAGSKKEEVARLEKELDQEVRYRDTITWSVGVLQQSVEELQQQLKDAQEEDGDGSEYKLRYEAQTDLNSKLEEQTLWYIDEVTKTKEKIKKAYARVPYNITTMCQEFTYDQDLDEYNEFELLRLVKTLERERNNIYSDLRNQMWLLDNQSKEYHHLKELVRAYTGDLTIVNRSLETMWRQRSYNRNSITGVNTPVTSPGGLSWSSGQSGIRPSQRILDPRKGPIRKTVGVRSLPRLDQDALDLYDSSSSSSRKARTRSRGRSKHRAKSLDAKKANSQDDVVGPLKSEDEARISKSGEAPSLRSSSGVFEESSYEASNEASTTASVELCSDKSEDTAGNQSVRLLT